MLKEGRIPMTKCRVSVLLCGTFAFLGFSTGARAADWNAVDCSKSEITFPGDNKCELGPEIGGTCKSGGGGGVQQYEQYNVYTANVSPDKPRMSVKSISTHSKWCSVVIRDIMDTIKTSYSNFMGSGEKWSPVRDFL
jgi:hypothetical protein